MPFGCYGDAIAKWNPILPGHRHTFQLLDDFDGNIASRRDPRMCSLTMTNCTLRMGGLW